MKKITLLVALIAVISMNAQLTEGFEDITTLQDNGWTFLNVSDDPVNASVPDYQQGDEATFPAFEGPGNSYIGVNFNSTAGSIIDNWAILPSIELIDGDTFTFYTRTAAGSTFPDALQVRISMDGDSSTLPTATDLGSFTTLALDINPELAQGGYPEAWELQTVTIEGVPAATDVRIAFRYFVTDAGPAGNNSNFIGIDSVEVDSVLSLADNTIEGLSTFVANNALTINARNPLENVTIHAINGQVVVSQKLVNTTETIDISALPTGMYIASVQTEGQVETIKFVK